METGVLGSGQTGEGSTCKFYVLSKCADYEFFGDMQVMDSKYVSKCCIVAMTKGWCLCLHVFYDCMVGACRSFTLYW